MSRVAGAGALIGAIVLAAVVLLGGRGDYTVHARFQTASQLVRGNEVQVGGRRVGTVEDIRLTRDRQAEAVLRIDDPAYAPLHRGVEAIIRQASLAGVANRYVDLRLPPAGAASLPDGGVIPATDTESAVDIDQLFNTFDPRTRRALQGVVHGAARMFRGKDREISEGLLYLNPALASSDRLVGELDSDTVALERFLGSSARFVTDVAAERDQLRPAVSNLAEVTGALSTRRRDLGRAIDALPGVMRRANSTFVNLRAALDDLDPLVDDARPAARALTPLARDLRVTARGARPTLRDLAALVRSRGADNDVIELLRGLTGVRDAGVPDVTVDGRGRPGALPATARALSGATDPIAFLRPYSVDLTGWFDTFSHTGVYDAIGGTGRIAFHNSPYTDVGGSLTYVPPDLRAQVFDRLAARGQDDRCPGSMERGTAWKPTPGFNCDLSQVPPGP